MTSTTSLSASATSAAATSTATCLDIKPGKNGYLPPEACDVILYYVPSFGAAIFFCVLYGLTTLVHLVQAIIYKKGYAWVVIMGSSWELLAFIFRALQTRAQANSNWDTMYTIFFLLAPIWINAFLYMTLGRMIHFYLPERKFYHITARRFGTLFVCLDIFAFIIQLAGAMITTDDNEPLSTTMMGVHIYMGGIGLQELFILGFTALTIQLHRTMIRMDNNGQCVERFTRGAFPWRWLFYSIYFALGMITIRIIFRISQYAQGTSTSNPVLTHEAYEYIFDAAPMFLALVALNIFHPGRVIQGEGSKFEKVSRAEKKERKRAEKERKRAAKEAKKLGRQSLSSNEGAEVPLQTYGDREESPRRFYDV